MFHQSFSPPGVAISQSWYKL